MKRFGFRYIRVLLCIVLTTLILAGDILPVKAGVEISAPSAILIEASTGEVIYELNSTERRSPASITKIMNLLLIFENLDEV